jgi:hypothetical protein
MESIVDIELYNNIGDKIKTLYSGNCMLGENIISIRTESLITGKYLICIKNKENIHSLQLLIIK